MTTQVPFVSYLRLGDSPRLVANECRRCGARYFGRRNACASCFATDFVDADVATEGTVVSFTIVSLAPPGVAVPYVSAIVDCAGTKVRANLTNVQPDPTEVLLGMQVRMTTLSIGTDEAGTEAINYAFEPIA